MLRRLYIRQRLRLGQPSLINHLYFGFRISDFGFLISYSGTFEYHFANFGYGMVLGMWVILFNAFDNDLLLYILTDNEAKHVHLN